MKKVAINEIIYIFIMKSYTKYRKQSEKVQEKNKMQ